MADQSRLFRLQVISPDRIFYDGEVEMVEMRTSEGEIGVLKNHIPLTAILVPGVLKIKEDGGERKAALHDGFVEIFGDHITILAESCEWPEDIDVHRAQEAKLRAERRLSSGDAEVNVARAELALRRSLLRLELAQSQEK